MFEALKVRLVEMADWNIVRVKQVNFGGSATQGLGQQEETANSADQGGGAKIESDLAAQIASVGIVYVGEDERL